MIEVRLNSALRVNHRDLPDGAAQQIRDRLTIANGDKPAALKRGDWGAKDLPDHFELWGDIGEELVMMRGFAAELRVGLEAMGCGVSWIDETVCPQIPLAELVQMTPLKLWAGQEPIAQAILQHRQGVVQAPTGFGKTACVLETIRRAGTTALIYVNRIGLARQWRDRAREHLGTDVGFIGDGVWEEKSITIAITQTLYRKHEALERQGWFARWGATVYDEAHACLSDSHRALIACCVSRYLIGVTATPQEGDWRQPILLNALGPIFHQTTDAELRKTGRRVAPLVKIVRTDFKWTPQGADEHLTDPATIYRRIIAALVDDHDRLALIVKTICDQPESCAQLVVSKRLKYISNLAAMLAFEGRNPERIFLMRGQESGDERMEIARQADKGSCIILSTVADEGLDIPRLDRLHLVWPARRELTIIQQMGRVLRQHPAKTGTEIVDYWDSKQGVLRSQAYARRKVFVQAGYAIDDQAVPTRGEK